MTRQELIQEIRQNQLEAVYKKELPKATRFELERIYYSMMSDFKEEHFSYSQLNMYQRCGLQYFYRYIQGIKLPPNGSLVRGSSLHEVWAMDGINKKKTGTPLSIPDKKEIYHNLFSVKAEEAIFSEEDPREVMLSTGNLAIPVHHQNTEGEIPIEVELEAEMYIDDRRILGYIDKVTEAGIKDMKVKGKSMSEQDMQDLQLPIYSCMTGITTVGYEPYIITSKGCKAQKTIGKEGKIPLVKEITEQEMARARATAKLFIDAIDKNVFIPCNPSSWVCMPKWCGYFDLCNEEILDA